MKLNPRRPLQRPYLLSHPRQSLLAFWRDARLRLRLQVGLASALAVGLFLSGILFSGLLSLPDRALRDFLYQPLKPSGQVVVIAIDKKSLDEIGPWPWPLAIHAGLLERMSAAPPRVVAFDLLFPQSPLDAAGFAASMRKAGNVLLTTVGVEGLAYAPHPESVPEFDVLVLPTSELRDAAAGIGHRMLAADSDGVVRRVPLAIVAAPDSRYNALGLQAALAYSNIKDVDFDLAQRRVIMGATRIPVDEYGRTLLNFSSAHEGIPLYSYSDVLRGLVPAANFAGKIVMVGGIATTEPETYATPLTSGNNTASNVVLEAGLADMLVSNPPVLLREQGALEQIGLILLVALISGLTLPHVRPLSASALTLLYLLAILLAGFEAFNRGIILSVLYPGLALIMTFGLIATFRYLSEERRRQFLTTLFRRYLPAESVGPVVEAIDRGELPLTGTRRNVTVLYADLRGFAALSEGLAPEAVLQLVNRYLELILRAIQAEAGTVSKPMGDAVVAIWNAPLDQADHAPRALHAALDMRRSLLKFQKRADDQGVNFGIGLATGWAVLGNISALGKVEYTLVGETVNVAARISAFAGNNQILADATTAQAATEDVEVRELTPVRIRGRKEPLPVWEIRDTFDLVTEQEEEEELEAYS